MAFSSGGGGGAMADINVTPLVDVMLVLLIIFMVTAPMPSFEIGVDLPQKNPNVEPPDVVVDPIRLRIDDSGQLFWNGAPISKSALTPSLLVEAMRDPQPVLEIDTSPEVRYEVLTDTLSTARNAGMTKIGFVEMMGR